MKNIETKYFFKKGWEDIVLFNFLFIIILSFPNIQGRLFLNTHYLTHPLKTFKIIQHNLEFPSEFT